MSMDYDAHPEIAKDGSVTFRGVDFSGKLRVHFRNKTILVIHRSGGKCWDGNFNPWRYVPAQFFVYRIVKDHATRPTVERIVEFDVKKGRV